MKLQPHTAREAFDIVVLRAVCYGYRNYREDFLCESLFRFERAEAAILLIAQLVDLLRNAREAFVAIPL